jgi:hypothetical protein
VLLRLLALAASLFGAFVAGTMFPTSSIQAQVQQERLKQSNVAEWLAVSFMKVPVEKEADYLRLEREHWKAVAEHLIKEGTLRYWALYRVRSGTGPKVEWSYVTMNSYSKADTSIVYPLAYAALKRQLPYSDLLKQTQEAREILRTESYELIDFAQ